MTRSFHPTHRHRVSPPAPLDFAGESFTNPEGRLGQSQLQGDIAEGTAALLDCRPTVDMPPAAGSTGGTPGLLSARERLRRRGPSTLSTTDLLVVALGPGSERPVQALLHRHGAEGLPKLSFNELMASCRLGKGGASRLAALLEFHRRLEETRDRPRPKLTRPAEVYEQVRGIAAAKKEHLVGLYLDAQNGLLHSETISVGSLNTTRTHPREILYPAIQCLALGFILAHNHPSGCLEPSPEDLEFTLSVKRAGELMGIELYDHLIVSRAGFTSMRERGTL